MRTTSATAYRERRSDPDFARGWQTAFHRSAPVLEQIAWERAAEGWEEPVYHQGALVGTRRRYSDALLTALLRRDGATVDPKLARAGPKELRRIATEAARAAGGLFIAEPRATKEEIDRAIMKQLATSTGASRPSARRRSPRGATPTRRREPLRHRPERGARLGAVRQRPGGTGSAGRAFGP